MYYYRTNEDQDGFYNSTAHEITRAINQGGIKGSDGLQAESEYVYEKNRMSQGLMEKEKFTQLMTEATHIQGGHIDHVYWRNFLDLWTGPVVERYSPYYSDHDASCITITRK